METVNHTPRKKENGTEDPNHTSLPLIAPKPSVHIMAVSNVSLPLPPPPTLEEISRIQSGAEVAVAMSMVALQPTEKSGSAGLQNTDIPLSIPSEEDHRKNADMKTNNSQRSQRKESGQEGSSPAPRHSSKKTVLEENGIIMGKVIGAGTYAKVKIAYLEKMKSPVAIKIISKTKAPKEYTEKFLPREIESVKGLHHENLIQFYQSIETNHRVYLVMQLAENGTILDYIRTKHYLDEETSRKLFRQLISAVNYCHSKGVVHRDIKCENLLLDAQYNLKLIDFGFARNRMLTNDDKAIMSKTFCGSYAYASPEILKAISYDPFKSDIWATGVVFYAMVFGRLPFDGSNLVELLKRVTGKLVFPRAPTISNSCKHLIIHILAPLKMRYRISDIQEHPWFSGRE